MAHFPFPRFQPSETLNTVSLKQTPIRTKCGVPSASSLRSGASDTYFVGWLPHQCSDVYACARYSAWHRAIRNTWALGIIHRCAISLTCDGPDCVPWPSPWPNPHAAVLLQNMTILGDRIFIEVIKLKWGLGWTIIQYKDIPYILYPYIVIIGRGSLNTDKERGKTTLRHKERPSYKPRTQVWHRSRP